MQFRRTDKEQKSRYESDLPVHTNGKAAIYTNLALTRMTIVTLAARQQVAPRNGAAAHLC